MQGTVTLIPVRLARGKIRDTGMPELAPAATPYFSRRDIVSILSGLMLAMFLASLDQTIVATSLSTMAQDLSGWRLMSWVVSAYLVASTVTTPIYGRLSDLYGRRPILSVAISLFLGASVLCALSQTMPQLVGARVLQGVGGGGLRSVAQAAIADVIPPRERGRYQGYFSSVMAISNVLGPVLGGFFADYLSWHWIFWINIPFGAAALFLCNRNLRRLPKPRRKPIIDWLGAALIVAAATPILIALGSAEAAASWGDVKVLVPLGIGILFLAGLVAWEREARSPILPLRLFANRVFAVANVITFSMSMVMIAMIILVPLDFELGAGMAPNEAGVRLIPMTGGTVLGSFIAGQLISRTGHYRIFPILGAGAMTGLCAAIAFAGLGRWWLPDAALTALLGVSFGFQLPSVVVPVQNALELGDAGIGLSVVMFFRLMGGAFGVALLTALLVGDLNSGALAVPGHDVLGPNPGIALLHLNQQEDVNPALLASLQDTIRTAFSHVFLCATAISALTTFASLGFKEIPLRGR
jgi:EmrB/QacA subfamily drug resistance transporter